MQELTKTQRRYLIRLAQRIAPLAMVGKHGITDTVVGAVDEALAAHELVKVRFVDHKEDKEPLGEELARRSRSEIVARIGHVVVLWRQHPEKDRRKVELPPA